MSSYLNNKQKSLKRRFLLILGIATLICVVTVGLMFIFYDKLDQYLGFSNTQKFTFGGLFIAYGILRFLRILKKQPDEE